MVRRALHNVTANSEKYTKNTLFFNKCIQTISGHALPKTTGAGARVVTLVGAIVVTPRKLVVTPRKLVVTLFWGCRGIGVAGALVAREALRVGEALGAGWALGDIGYSICFQGLNPDLSPKGAPHI